MNMTCPTIKSKATAIFATAQVVGGVFVVVGSLTFFPLDLLGQLALLPGSLISGLYLENLLGKWVLEMAMQMPFWVNPAGLMDRVFLPGAILFNLAIFSMARHSPGLFEEK